MIFEKSREAAPAMAPPSPSLTQLLNPVTALWAGMRLLGNAEGRLGRRVDVSDDGHAHIEMRGADRPEHAALVADAKAAIERLDRVERAEVDAVVGRLIVVFDPAAIDADDLIESLETVEELHDVADERFPHDRADHPADRMPNHLNVFGIAADVAGLGYATAAQALHFMRLPAEIPGLVSVADNAPRVRRFLEGGLGPPTADVVMTTTNAAAQALGQGPLGLIVDIGHRARGGETADLTRCFHVVVDCCTRSARPDRNALGHPRGHLGESEREQLLVGIDDLVMAGGERTGGEDGVGERHEEMATAAVVSAPRSERETSGTANDGNPLGTGPVTATPRAARSSAQDAAMPRTTTTSAPGIRLLILSTTTRSPSETAPTMTVAPLASPRLPRMSTVSRMTPSSSLETPTSLLIWPRMRTTAAPVMYPTRTACEK